MQDKARDSATGPRGRPTGFIRVGAGLSVGQGRLTGVGTTDEGEQVTVRLTGETAELVRSAVDSLGVTLEDFAAEAMRRYAADTLADRRLFAATDDAWKELADLLGGPAPDEAPRLRELLDDGPEEEAR